MSGIKSVLNQDNYLFHEYIGEADNLLRESEKANADLLIIDAEMPVSFGVNTIKKIKEKLPCLKIIVVDNPHHLAVSVKSIVQAGADACVSKYAENNPLREAVESVLRGKKYLCQSCTNALAKSFITKSPKVPVVLSEQEQKIIKFLAREYYNSEIADELNISQRTVETHRKNIMKKIGARNLAGIACYALNNRIVKTMVAIGYVPQLYF